MKKRINLMLVVIITTSLFAASLIARDRDFRRGGDDHHGNDNRRYSNKTVVYERHDARKPVIVERRVVVERPVVYAAPQPHFYVGFGVQWGSGPWIGNFTIGNSDVCMNTGTGVRRIAIPERGRYAAYDDVIVVHDSKGKVWVRRR